MARIQSRPTHDSEAQHNRDFQAINVKRPVAGSNHRSHQTEAEPVDNTKTRSANESPSHEFTIMGFPWQFALVIGVIAGSVLAVVLKTIGLL